MPAAAQDQADRLAAQVEAIAAPLVVRFKGSDPQFHILTPLGMNATSFNYSASLPDENFAWGHPPIYTDDKIGELKPCSRQAGVQWRPSAS